MVVHVQTIKIILQDQAAYGGQAAQKQAWWLMKRISSCSKRVQKYYLWLINGSLNLSDCLPIADVVLNFFSLTHLVGGIVLSRLIASIYSFICSL